MTNTQLGIGLARNFASKGIRYWEDDNTIQYVSARKDLYFQDLTYQPGEPLPFDVDGVSYSSDAMVTLRRYWDYGLIEPAV